MHAKVNHRCHGHRCAPVVSFVVRGFISMMSKVKMQEKKNTERLKFQDFNICSNFLHADADADADVDAGGITILVIRFMADLLRKYRGSVVIMVGRGGAEPHYVHN